MFRGIYHHLIQAQEKYTHVLCRTSNSQNPRSRRDVVTPGQRLEHAQHVSSLKIYFLSRLTAVASRILKSLLMKAGLGLFCYFDEGSDTLEYLAQ